MTRFFTASRSTLMTSLIGAVTAASLLAGLGAAPASANGFVAGGGVVKYIGYGCPYGYHPGYGGYGCYPNHSIWRVCPPGTHLGYEGKYCWRNRVIYY